MKKLTVESFCDVTDKDTQAQDTGDADHLNTQGNKAQVETMGNWFKRTSGT